MHFDYDLAKSPRTHHVYYNHFLHEHDELEVVEYAPLIFLTWNPSVIFLQEESNSGAIFEFSLRLPSTDTFSDFVWKNGSLWIHLVVCHYKSNQMLFQGEHEIRMVDKVLLLKGRGFH